MTTPLLRFEGVSRSYRAGDQVVHALRDVTLSIDAGEMVAIMGVSGSGKSTLMNILGCLDRPTAGSYRVAGEETATMDPDALARLRREHFGFIFQRYQLLGDLSALRNVEIPAIYAGRSSTARHARATELLQRLGLGDRLTHRPRELSGGQQQRVSIARALVNGGEVILADEPTGALDSVSSEEVLRILQELHAQGQTVIVVTHDAKVAAHADRIIELSDGVVVSDRATRDVHNTRGVVATHEAPRLAEESRWANVFGRVVEAAAMALRSMASHRLRTLLTTLGIVIGIASVVSVVALGEGARRQVLADISSLGSNTIDVYPGRGWGDVRAGLARPLSNADAKALARLDYIDSVTPQVITTVALRKGSVDRTTAVNGVGSQFFRVRGYAFAEGQAFDEASVALQAQDAVIDDNAKRALFPDGSPPLGQVILVGSVPVRVVGVTREEAQRVLCRRRAQRLDPVHDRDGATDRAGLAAQRDAPHRGPGQQQGGRGRREAPPDHAPRQVRLLPDEQRHGARDGRGDDADLSAARLGDRGDLADRRRHRRDEHHAGLGGRADAGGSASAWPSVRDGATSCGSS